MCRQKERERGLPVPAGRSAARPLSCPGRRRDLAAALASVVAAAAMAATTTTAATAAAAEGEAQQQPRSSRGSREGSRHRTPDTHPGQACTRSLVEMAQDSTAVIPIAT